MALMAMLFWGVSYVWTKIVFEYYQPVTIMLIRLSISAALMYLVVAWRKGLPRIEKKDFRSFLLLAFFSPFCYFLGENYGLLHVSPTIAAVIIATIPLFAPLVGFLAFREKLSAVNIVGFLISFSGIWVMVLDHEMRFSASPWGVFFLFMAVAAALINMVYLKKLASRYSPFTIIFFQNSLGALMFLPVFLLLELNSFIRTSPSLPALGSLLALAVFGSTLAFIFYTASVRTLGVARTSIFGNLVPIFTALTSLILLKEAIDGGKIAGMTLVILGLLMTQLSSARKRILAKRQARDTQKNAELRL